MLQKIPFTFSQFFMSNSHLKVCMRLRQDSASAVRRSVVGGDWTRREGEKPWRPNLEPLPRLPTKAEPSLPRSLINCNFLDLFADRIVFFWLLAFWTSLNEIPKIQNCFRYS